MRPPKIVFDVLLQAIQAAPEINEKIRNWSHERAARKQKELFDQRWDREKRSERKGLNPLGSLAPPGLRYTDWQWESYQAQRKAEEAAASRPVEQPTRQATKGTLKVHPRKPKVGPSTRPGTSPRGDYHAEIRRRAEMLADWANKPKKPK